MRSGFRMAWLLLVSVAVTGCQQSAEPATPEKKVALQFGTPLNGRLQDTYMRTCHNCHMNDVPGIPRAGDPEDWAPRAAQGLDVLVQHAMYGYRGMPPMGLCSDCTEADMRVLVAYMAGLTLPDSTPTPTPTPTP